MFRRSARPNRLRVSPAHLISLKVRSIAGHRRVRQKAWLPGGEDCQWSLGVEQRGRRDQFVRGEDRSADGMQLAIVNRWESACMTAQKKLAFIGKSQTIQPSTQGGEYLTFRLGLEEYGIDILSVQEIRSYEQPTRIANAPSFVKGVLNLRGIIVPIVDLRMKFACSVANYDTFTVLILLNVCDRTVGVVVDSVGDVVQLPSAAIKPAPDLPTRDNLSNHVTGLGSIGERMLILLDIIALMGSSSMGLTVGEAA